MTNPALAQLSNNLVYSAIAVYLCAFLAYATAVAASVRSPAGVVEPEPVREPVAAGVGAAGVGAAGVAAPYRPADFFPGEGPRAHDHGGEGWGEGPRAHDHGGGGAGKAARIGLSLTVAACALHAGAVLTRGLSADRVPWGNMYEFALTGTLAAVGAFLVLARKVTVSYLGVVLLPAVLLGLGVAVTLLYSESAQLLPVLESYWLVVHVAAMIVSFGALSVGAALGLLYFARKSPRFAGRLSKLPSADRIDTASYRLHAFVFPLYTFAVLSGAVWAENAWGRYWGWDPKETWAFIVWVAYAAYLHARVTAGWRGGRAAAIALIGYAAFLFNLFGINYLVSGLHSYAG